MIRGIPSAEFMQHAAQIMPFLEGFADRDLTGLKAEHLKAEILAAQRQVWSINDFQALGLTRVMSEAVLITHCAGTNRHEWHEAFDTEIRKWARALGKKRIIATVRPGWARFGRQQGYRETHREMTLEL